MRIPLSWLLEYAAIGSGGVDGADVTARTLTAWTPTTWPGG